MTNRKTTRRALVLSVLSLLLCMSMLVGTTFAWFTDSVTSGNNKIVAGNLDVELYNDVTINEGKKVSEATPLFEEVELWEPGAVAYENLTVVNEGTLALKYQLDVNFTNENKVGEYGLSQILKVGVVEKGIPENTSREDAVKLVESWLPMESFSWNGELAAKTADETVALVIYWEPSANDNNWNVNNGKTTTDGEALHIDLGINLFATQLEAEFDSFGDDYDAGAYLPTVYSIDELTSAIANGDSVKLGADIVVTETLKIPADAEMILDLNGYEIEAGYQEGSTAKHAYALSNYGDLTLVGGSISARGIYNQDGATLTVNGTEINALDYNGGACIWSYGTGKVVVNDGKLTGNTGVIYSEGPVEINGGTYTCYSGIADDGTQLTAPTYNIRAYNGLKITDGTFTSRHGVISVGGGEAVIEGGDYTIEFAAATTSNVVYVYGNTDMTINGGSFISDNTSGKADSGAAVLVSGSNAKVTINDGTFVGMNGMVSGNATLYGGTYNTVWDYNHYDKLENLVADGYLATQNADGSWTVAEPSNPWYDVFEVKDGDNVVITSGTAQEYVEIAHSGGDLTIKNVTFQNGLTIYTNNASNTGTVTLENCTINLNDGTGDPAHPLRTQHKAGYGLNLNLTNGSDITFVFKNCTFTKADDYSYTGGNSYNVYIGGGYSAKSISFTGCTFQDSGKHAIGCSSEGSSQYYELTVTGCNFVNWNNDPAITNGAAIRGNLPSATFAAEINISGNTFGNNNGSTQKNVAIDSWTGTWN